MFTSRPVYALLLQTFLDGAGFYIIYTCYPTYMKTVLNYDITKVISHALIVLVVLVLVVVAVAAVLVHYLHVLPSLPEDSLKLQRHTGYTVALVVVLICNCRRCCCLLRLLCMHISLVYEVILDMPV